MNATIQEIEGIDDYWGPAFRSVYEGEGHEAFVQQLDERIIQHDKEIEKLCNFHYQKKRKRRRRPNKLRGICEDQEEALQSSMSQYEGNNNHIPKRRCIDPKRLGGYINTFPESGTQCKPSDPHSSSKVSDHNLYSENPEESSDMGILSDEFEEITKYHTLQHQKQENHQLISKEPDSSADDLRLYLRNRNLTESVDRPNILISVSSVKEAGNRLEQQTDYSMKDSVDCLKSTRVQRPIHKEVDVNSANDLRSYLRSKLSDEQLGQNEPSHEHYCRQSPPEAIQYDQRNDQQVELDRDQRQFLSSKYNIGPWQYDNIRYEKGQSPCTSVKHNKDQILSISTERRQNRHELIEYGKDQSKILSSEHIWTQSLPVAEHYEERQSSCASAKHDKSQGSMSSERNRTLSRHESFEKDTGQRQHVLPEQDRNQNRKADRQRDEIRPKFAEDNEGQNLPMYKERYVRPSRPSSSEHYTSRNLYVNIESRQSPNSFKEHRPRSPHGPSEHDGINGQRVFAHQLRGQSHHSAEYDSSDSYSRGESTERPKVRSRPSSTESNYIRQSRPSSSENYKQSGHPFIEYQKGQNRKQTRGSRQFLSDYDRKSLSSHELADFDRVKDRQALAKRRRIGKSRPLSSELNQREITAATMEYQRRERRHALSDKKSQTCPFSAEHVQSGQSTEYIRGRNRSDSLEGYENRNRPTSAQNQLSYSEFESQIRRNKSNECFSGERSSLLSDQFSGVQTDLRSVNMSARHNRSYVSAVLQRVDDRPLMSDTSRQVSSETCTKQQSLLPETQRETYRKSSDREELRRPLSTQKTPTSVEMCKSTVADQHNSALCNIPTPSFEECPAISSSAPLHSISNRVTSSQFFQNEILELELSHVERNDIENWDSYDRPLKKADTTKLKPCYDDVIDASETVLISDSNTEISMDISSPRSIPEEKNATEDFSNDLRSKLTNQLEASALLPTRGSSEPRDHSRGSFAEISSIQDISGNNLDSVETVIVKSEPYDTSYDAISLNASNESLKVTESRLNQDSKAPERLPGCHVKSELIDHDTNREISSPVDKNIAQNRLQQETPDYCPKFPSQSCDAVNPSGFVKSEIKQESYNETLNTVQSTLEIDLDVNSSCGPNDKDKLGQALQATAVSSPVSDGSFKVSVRDINTNNLLLSGANVDPCKLVKCSKLMLDNIPNSSKGDSSNKAEMSPESRQIQDEQLFTNLKPIDMETQFANAIPGYDPSNKNHNINEWIDSVNKVAAVRKWSDQQVVGYAIAKIIGCDLNSNISWSEWQEKLRTAFPPKVNYGMMLQNMLNRSAKVGDSLVKYYYEKKTLLDKCNITGEKAIECIIFGIEDESVRTILESLNFDNQELLLTFLSNFKN